MSQKRRVKNKIGGQIKVSSAAICLDLRSGLSLGFCKQESQSPLCQMLEGGSPTITKNIAAFKNRSPSTKTGVWECKSAVSESSGLLFPPNDKNSSTVLVVFVSSEDSDLHADREE